MLIHFVRLPHLFDAKPFLKYNPAVFHDGNRRARYLFVIKPFFKILRKIFQIDGQRFVHHPFVGVRFSNPGLRIEIRKVQIRAKNDNKYK